MDHHNSLKIMRALIGKNCRRTLACNSLKIRFGEKSPYIWLDPPWQFWENDRLLADSLSYPENEAEFKAYSDTLTPLNKTTLIGVEHSVKSGLTLYFQNQLKLTVPTTIEAVDADNFYHHWYASE